MKKKVINGIEVQRSSGNVYADLGLPDAEKLKIKTGLREFDETCLTPVHTLSPEEIKDLRLCEHISQPVFARYLNVSKNLVSD